MNIALKPTVYAFNLVPAEKCLVMKRVLLILLTIWSTVAIANDVRISRSEYIDLWKDVAVDNMVLHGIPASITLAQGILESGDGNSELARKANNHFGIKCHSDWNGKRVYHDDDAKGECFRKYKDARESFADHSDFLKRKRYEPLFSLEITDYKGWAHGLKKAGYATNPQYANRLIRIIEDNDLTRYDKIGLAMRTDDVVADDHPRTRAKKPSKVKAKGDKNDEFSAIALGQKRNIKLSDNRIKYVYGKAGDTFESIAEELEMMTWQIRRYNDFNKNHRIAEGEIVYLQPKRARAKSKTHVMQEGETLWDVSQNYGVKLKKLYKRNELVPGSLPEPGFQLKLR